MSCSMIVKLQDSVESIKSIIIIIIIKTNRSFTTAKKISELLVVSQ